MAGFYLICLITSLNISLWYNLSNLTDPFDASISKAFALTFSQFQPLSKAERSNSKIITNFENK